ncbi:porin [Roseateles asaccharophilus]|uniref:Porin n=1 Tax=Roseateles asaccharophilus TaxID=582607 RepID=A0ABU2AG47_9BURK|nr:porin [Roseateles asaccharophilus]MDR7335593.1 putative porin [Roseateles asaccharophilus]
MKKIALVAALAAISAAPAFAQSSVTLWGRINTTVESQKTGSQDRIVRVQNNSSRLGFKGTEDLGGGLKASFSLEHGVNSDSGTASGGNTFWNRASWVQLEGAFGGVRLGKWFPGSYFATADYVSMHNHDTGTSADALYGTQFTTNNKVSYFTPTVSGFNAEVGVAAGEGTAPRAWDLAVNYDMGPLHAGFGYEKVGIYKQFAVRGLYELGAFTFGGYYQREEVSGFKSRDVGRLAAMYAVGQSEFHLNVGGSKSGGNGAFRLGGAKQYTLGYNYNLSKRTKVYGFYTKTDYNAPGQLDFNSLAVGVRHNF